jgi:hypothetical protein
MVQQLTLRPAQPEDFAFCERTYFEPMRATIDRGVRSSGGQISATS